MPLTDADLRERGNDWLQHERRIDPLSLRRESLFALLRSVRDESRKGAQQVESTLSDALAVLEAPAMSSNEAKRQIAAKMRVALEQAKREAGLE